MNKSMTNENSQIKVLIVDDVADTRDNIRRLLQFENDVEVVGSAETGYEGIELAKKIRPDVVVIDINMPDIDGIRATELIRKSSPHTQIIILSVQGDPHYMRRAMLAGARDFLTKPPSADELTSAIRRAGKMAIEEQLRTPSGLSGAKMPIDPSRGALVPTSNVISVYSPKGGAGCTTVAINLAMALHNDDSPTVIVDGNLQFGDVAVFLNEQTKNSIVDLAPRTDELDTEILEEVLVTHAKSGVKILAAPPRPEYAENITGEQFSKVLAYLKHFYTYVVIDTATALDDITLASIDASDIIILITTQDIPAIKNTRHFFDLTHVLNVDLKRVIFVMNRYDKRIGITPEKVGESFKHEITSVMPLEDRVVIPSINRGTPFVLTDKSKPISRAVLSLAKEVRKKINEFSELQVEDTKDTNKIKQ
jgi:pilus assembly protein CpaE